VACEEFTEELEAELDIDETELDETELKELEEERDEELDETELNELEEERDEELDEFELNELEEERDEELGDIEDALDETELAMLDTLLRLELEIALNCEEVIEDIAVDELAREIEEAPSDELNDELDVIGIDETDTALCAEDSLSPPPLAPQATKKRFNNKIRLNLLAINIC
jgi:hypothetical protein